MTTEQLHELHPGDRVLVNAPGDLSQPPRALPPAEATFVSFAEDGKTPLPWAVVCGLPDGWADEDNAALGLRVLHPGQLLGRVSDDERVERMRRRLQLMAKVAA